MEKVGTETSAYIKFVVYFIAKASYVHNTQLPPSTPPKYLQALLKIYIQVALCVFDSKHFNQSVCVSMGSLIEATCLGKLVRS